jgi:hypothetical protein
MATSGERFTEPLVRPINDFSGAVKIFLAGGMVFCLPEKPGSLFFRMPVSSIYQLFYLRELEFRMQFLLSYSY